MTLVRQRPGQARSVWTREDSEYLERGLAELGLSASVEQMTRLRTYAELVLKWNRTYNLLGTTDTVALVQDHLLDSLATIPALTRWLPGDAVLLDIGSGAGLPGLVLAIMLHPLPILLVEPNGKKTAFLRQVVAQCRLETVQVIESRIEELAPTHSRPTHSTPSPMAPMPSARTTRSAEPRTVTTTPHFICRAFTSLDRFAALCRPQLSSGSLLFAMKAARVAEELAELDESLEVLAVEPLQAVGKDAQRNLVVMQSKPTASHLAYNNADRMHGSAAGGMLGNHSHDR